MPTEKKVGKEKGEEKGEEKNRSANDNEENLNLIRQRSLYCYCCTFYCCACIFHCPKKKFGYQQINYNSTDNEASTP